LIAKTENTYWVKLYISGSLNVIEQTCRKYCLTNGLCVTVTPTRFIYTGGEETGAEIGGIQYPRFPESEGTILAKMKHLAFFLLEETCQHSILIMTPQITEWITKRDNDCKEINNAV
jgi:hypothetical protein